MKDLIYYMALSSNSYIGPRRYIMIKERLGLDNFFSLSTREQMEFLGIRSDRAVSEFERMLIEGERIYKLCNKLGIKTIRLEDETYPSLLKEIEDPPFLLYMYGNLNHSIKKLAIVGTRHPTKEAIEVNKYFTRELVNYGVGIVSGLARGHDGIAQKTALENDGYTIAVVGGGVDVIYPLENKNLYYQIKEKGCIISEYPPATYPLKQNFPLRNRIISGISNGVFVVQAPEKSGALITANYAEAQGRDVYTIPGNPLDPSYAGTNRLIQMGVKVVISPEDIVSDLLGKDAKKRVSQLSVKSDLSEEELGIISHLKDETHIDEIVSRTKMPQNKVLRLLTLLEVRGYVTQLPGGYYRSSFHL